MLDKSVKSQLEASKIGEGSKGRGAIRRSLTPQEISESQIAFRTIKELGPDIDVTAWKAKNNAITGQILSKGIGSIGDMEPEARNIPPGEDMAVWEPNHNVRGREARGALRGYRGQRGGYGAAPRPGRGRAEPNWQVGDHPWRGRGRGYMYPPPAEYDNQQVAGGRGRGARFPLYPPPAEGDGYGGYEHEFNNNSGRGRGQDRYYESNQGFLMNQMNIRCFQLMDKLTDKILK